jgi:hypothetical protein
MIYLYWHRFHENQGNIGTNNAQAVNEYNQALADYQEAMRKYDNAKNVKAVSDTSFNVLMGGGTPQKLIGLMNKATTTSEIQDAERNLIVAKERLEKAKSKLEASNWK